MGDFNFVFRNGELGIGGLKIDLYKIGYKFFRIMLIILIMYVLIRVGIKIINRFVEKQSRLKFSLDERKSKTFAAVLKSILRYSVYFFGIIGILTEFFGTISVTFAGIGGVAIGFGTQNLIRDILNGFFILFEDQFSVGDYINIDDKGGIVESIELRITKIRDFNGDLHIIPNGLISKVTNHSRGNSRVLVEVDVPYEEDVDNVIKIIDEVCELFKKENTDMVEGPKVAGVTALKDIGLTVRVVGKAKTMTHWDCEMNLRKEIKKALTRRNIQFPYPKRKIIKGE